MTAPKPIFSDGKVHVMSEKCSTCIFRPGNLMHLSPGKVKEMVDRSIGDESAITCHKTLPFAANHGQQQAVCRGFMESYAGQVSTLRLALHFGIIKEVEFDERS